MAEDCRICKRGGADIYLRADGNKSVRPICRDCYEDQIRKQPVNPKSSHPPFARKRTEYDYTKEAEWNAAWEDYCDD